MTAAGTYSVTATAAGGCSSTASVSVSPGPDLTLLLYARPSIHYGSSPFTVVVDVFALTPVVSSEPLTLRLTKDSKYAVSFPSSATLVGGKSVQNSAWSFDGVTDEGYYVLTRSGGMGSAGLVSVGLEAVLNPGATTGSLTVSGVLGSVCERKLTNNSDADKIEYFQQ